jgi:hypothetical protein
MKNTMVQKSRGTFPSVDNLKNGIFANTSLRLAA